MRPTKSAEAATVAKKHLVRLRLDDAAFRECAYQHGLITESDLEPEIEPERTRADEVGE